MINQIIERLLEFDDDEWKEYLSELCNNANPNPSLQPIARELISQLFWIYNELNEINKAKRLLFTKSVLLFLKNVSIQSADNKLIYDLIYFVHETEPIEHRELLESLIRKEKFVNLYFGKDNLHLLLIKAYANIEDTEKMYLEEYLLSTHYKKSPYFLYLIMNYYSSLKQTEKALDAFCDYFIEDGGKNLNDEFCKEVYHALKDSIPQYIDLSDFLEQIINDDININHENPCLSHYVNKFINDLKSYTDNIGLAFFAEDVINNNLKNYWNRSEIDELAKIKKYNDLIVRYTDKFFRRSRIESRVPNLDTILTETLKGNPKFAVEPLERYFTAGVSS